MDTKRCPHCAEEILEAAVKCKHCGSTIALPRKPLRLDRLFFGLLMIWAMVRVVLGLAGAADGQYSYLTPVWNGVVALALIAIFVNLRRGKAWALDWAIGTSVLNSIGDAINAPKVPFLALTAVIGALAAVFLYRVRRADETMQGRRVAGWEVAVSAVMVLCGVGVGSVEELIRKKAVAPVATTAPAEQPSLAAVAHAQPAPAEAPPQAPEDPRFALARKARGIDLADLLREADSLENRRVTYAHLKKNAARYFGRAWKGTGLILEISEVNGATFARVAIDEGEVFYVMMPGTTEYVQNDVVDLAGYLAGDFTYESTARWNITIPTLVAKGMYKAGTFRKGKRAVARDE